MKGLRVTKSFKQIKFEGIQGELFPGTITHKVFETNTLSCEIANYRKSLISVLQIFFTSIDKISILEGSLGARLSFYEVLKFSWYFLISYDPKS